MPPRTNMQIYLKDQNLHKQIFKYIWCQGLNKFSNIFKTNVQNVENMHLKDDIFGEMEQGQKIKYFQIYFDHKANIRIYSNIKSVVIWIQIFICGTKYSNIQIFVLIPAVQSSDTRLTDWQSWALCGGHSATERGNSGLYIQIRPRQLRGSRSEREKCHQF